MMALQTLLGYSKAEPFGPCGLRLASGRTFAVRPPGMIKALRSTVLSFTSTGEAPDVPDDWERVSLLLIESISHRDGPVHY